MTLKSIRMDYKVYIKFYHGVYFHTFMWQKGEKSNRYVIIFNNLKWLISDQNQYTGLNALYCLMWKPGLTSLIEAMHDIGSTEEPNSKLKM